MSKFALRLFSGTRKHVSSCADAPRMNALTDQSFQMRQEGEPASVHLGLQCQWRRAGYEAPGPRSAKQFHKEGEEMKTDLDLIHAQRNARESAECLENYFKGNEDDGSLRFAKLTLAYRMIVRAHEHLCSGELKPEDVRWGIDKADEIEAGKQG